MLPDRLGSARRRRARLATIIAAAAVSLFAIGCGGGEEAPPTAATTASAPAPPAALTAPPGDPVSLKVGVGDPSSLDQALYLADELGYFRQAGIELKLSDGPGRRIAGDVAAGKLDLAIGGVPDSLRLATDGEPVRAIYATSQIGGDGVMVARRGTVTPVEGAQPEPNNLIEGNLATIEEGTSAAAYADFYNARFNSNMKIEYLPGYEAVRRALESKRADAAVGRYEEFEGLIDDGFLDVILDPRPLDERSEPLGLQPQAERAVYGLAPAIEEDRDAIVRFLSVLNYSLAQIRRQRPEDTAGVLADTPAAGDLTADELAERVENDSIVVGTSTVEISGETWGPALELYAAWQPWVEPLDPKLRYERVVDPTLAAEAVALTSPGVPPTEIASGHGHG